MKIAINAVNKILMSDISIFLSFIYLWLCMNSKNLGSLNDNTPLEGA